MNIAVSRPKFTELLPSNAGGIAVGYLYPFQRYLLLKSEVIQNLECLWPHFFGKGGWAPKFFARDITMNNEHASDHAVKISWRSTDRAQRSRIKKEEE